MSITTNGWGAVNMASIDVVNQSIKKQNKLPSDFQAYSEGTMFGMKTTCNIIGSESDTSAKCNWAEWEIAPNGSGHIVYMSCTLGTAFAKFSISTSPDAPVNYDISNSVINISLDLNAVAQAENTDSKGTPNAIMADNTKPVQILNSTVINNLPNDGDTEIYYDMAVKALNDYFNENLSEFSAAFGVILLNGEISQDPNFKWLTPSAVSYAVETTTVATYFGILTMLDNDAITSQSQQIDTGVFSRIPTNANSALLISAEKFCKHILLPSAVAVVSGSAESDFDIGPDLIRITNNKDLKWDNFEMSDGSTIQPTIPKGGLDIHVDGTFIILEIIGIHYSPSVGITVSSNLTQKIELTIQQQTDGGYVLVPKKDSTFSQCTINSSVEVAEWLQITEIILDVVGAVAGLACGIGAIGGLVAAKATTTVVEASAEIAMDAVETAEIAAEETESAIETVSTAAESVDAVVAGTSTVTKGGFFASNFCKVATKVCGVIGGLAGLGISAIELTKFIENSEFDDIPSLNNFAANLLGTYEWPELPDASISGAELFDALILYTNIPI
jgi:hypothetical protein